jgi:hypothetical protein
MYYAITKAIQLLPIQDFWSDLTAGSRKPINHALEHLGTD